MLKWDQALNTDRLLSDESRAMMFTPYGSGYGYGWGIGQLFGHRQIIRFPTQSAVVVVLSNLETAPVVEVGRDLAAILFTADYRIPDRGTESQSRSE